VRSKNFKYLICVMLLMAMTGFFTSGCNQNTSVTPEKKERKVVVYTSVDQIFAEPILKDFETKTGIKVLPVFDVEAAKTTGLVNRLITEKDRPQADVFWNGEFAQTMLLKEKGVLTPYSSALAKGMPTQFVDSENYWTGVAGRARVIIINKNLIPKESYPKSIYDFLDPKYKGEQIGIAYPLFGTTATQAAALYAKLGPAAGKKFFEDLKAKGIRIVDGNSVVRDMVADGRLAFGLTDTDDAIGALKKGAPVEVLFPDQEDLGTLIIPGTVGLVAKGPNLKEGQEMIDYLLGKEVEEKLIKSGFSQIPFGKSEAQPEFLSVKGIKAMDVKFADIYKQMDTVKKELTEIFVR
jgi:iron(III) transport system substrate-binding protein